MSSSSSPSSPPSPPPPPRSSPPPSSPPPRPSPSPSRPSPPPHSPRPSRPSRPSPLPSPHLPPSLLPPLPPPSPNLHSTILSSPSLSSSLPPPPSPHSPPLPIPSTPLTHPPSTSISSSPSPSQPPPHPQQTFQNIPQTFSPATPPPLPSSPSLSSTPKVLPLPLPQPPPPPPASSASFRSSTPLGPLSDSFRPSWVLDIDDLTHDQKAAIVRRHLMNKDEQRVAQQKLHCHSGSTQPSLPDSVPHSQTPCPHSDSCPENSSQIHSSSLDPQTAGDKEYPTPFHLLGGDIHHALYKWANKRSSSSTMPSNEPFRSTNPLTLSRTRSLSASVASLRASELERSRHADSHHPDAQAAALTHKDIMEPGGFRRAFLYQKRAAIGKPFDEPDGKKITKSFIDFLSLYGHFGGEDLEEIDEGEEAAFEALSKGGLLENGQCCSDDDDDDGDDDDDDGGGGDGNELRGRVGETSLLLARPRNGPPTRNRWHHHKQPLLTERVCVPKYPGFKDGTHGTTTVPQAVLMALKSLVGTGVLFLARAFANGGMLFSVMMLVFVGALSLYSYVLLVETRLAVPGGFGEMGGILYGAWFRKMILCSLAISQLGFVAAYTIFIAQNLQAFVLAVTKCKTLVPMYALIFGQLVAYLPLAMIRNIQKLSWTALIADLFILIGLVYLFTYELHSISLNGLAPMELILNRDSFPLMIGTAVFAFEGIGLVIPITESMIEPQKFPAVLAAVMLGLTFLFVGAGACGYAAFGRGVKTVVLVNLPQDDTSVNAVQFLYSMAIMLSTPLQLFPAVRIMENGLFSESGKYSNKVKWQKNCFRTLTVISCATVAYIGAGDLDKFVALIGSVACVPLCFCYPAMLHYKAIARTLFQKTVDVALVGFGVGAAIYTTSQTVGLIVNDYNKPSSRSGGGGDRKEKFGMW